MRYNLALDSDAPRSARQRRVVLEKKYAVESRSCYRDSCFALGL
jgi:hypothetical protein